MPLAIRPGLQSDEEYHALTGKSVTNFTVVGSLLCGRKWHLATAWLAAIAVAIGG